ncbi:hypothetical protein C2E23DRAFT_886465 [Lenzites betulinus]|nr:hypothetical protein C2E23DRAFT_886465 [Lenzites betulinus]
MPTLIQQLFKTPRGASVHDSSCDVRGPRDANPRIPTAHGRLTYAPKAEDDYYHVVASDSKVHTQGHLDASDSEYDIPSSTQLDEEEDDIDLYYFSAGSEDESASEDDSYCPSSAASLSTSLDTAPSFKGASQEVPVASEAAPISPLEAALSRVAQEAEECSLGLIGLGMLIPIPFPESESSGAYHVLHPQGVNHEVDGATSDGDVASLAYASGADDAFCAEDTQESIAGFEMYTPSGWMACGISPPSSRVHSRPQFMLFDGPQIVVNTTGDNSEGGPRIADSASAGSFVTAAESFPDRLQLLSTSATRDFLSVPGQGPPSSPSVQFILEEFAPTPPLGSSPFTDEGEADLWPLSRSPSSAGLLTPPETSNLEPYLEPSPEFASNFAQAQFPELLYRSSLAAASARPSYYPWFDSFLEEYLDEEELVDVGEVEEACTEPTLDDDASPQSLWGPHHSTLHQAPFCSMLDLSYTEESQPLEEGSIWTTFNREENPLLSPVIATPEPFEDLWRSAKVHAFAGRVSQPLHGPCSGVQERPVDTGKARAEINAFASINDEINDLLDLYAPHESMSVIPPPSGEAFVSVSVPVPGSVAVSVSDVDAECPRAPVTSGVSAATPYPERLVREARDTFWANWSRKSDEDLSALFKASENVASGLGIFVEEGKTIRPLHGTKEFSCTFEPLHRPITARQQVKREAQDAFRVHWNASFVQSYF